jgi:conjugative relaxase-like TrwC/TraI family protein
LEPGRFPGCAGLRSSVVADVARFARIGAASVAYHEENVLGRADDHAGQALDYYGSRGETPLRWGGRGAARLGLEGEVTPHEFRSVFGEGGFVDPLTGQRLVKASHPGFELVIDAHKSVAALGTLGRAEEMHGILDAETAATLSYLEEQFAERGGSRGRARLRTATGGLTYAYTRHGTSREGDPHPHDHVLVTNIVEMHDRRGGWKALDSAALRDWLEAATMVGRLHAAAEAVKAGYPVAPDGGGSGRKRSWRVAGIPDEVCELFSKRRHAIDEYMDRRGYDTPQARKIAALNTRPIKRFTGVDELMDRWHRELADIGWDVDRLNQALEAARHGACGFAPELTDAQIDGIATDLFDVRGAFLRRSKTFTRHRIIAEVAPLLYGQDPAGLDRVIGRILADLEVVPMIGIDGAREQRYTTATVLITEARIAATVDRLASEHFESVPAERIDDAIRAKESANGYRFTPGQLAAAHAVAGSGRRVDVIVGVAGSGKTTALDAAVSALEAAGIRVLGTATSGQATRALHNETGVDANTVTRLLGLLDDHRLVLDHRTVIVLDEAAMTADADFVRLFTGAERAGAKVVLVGDHRQLSAIGPGGAFQAALERHPDVAVTMADNVRQADPAERETLDQLRHGSVTAAVDWYAQKHRIVVAPTRLDAMEQMVATWAADVALGRDAPMLAWRRRDTADLNQLARHRRIETGAVTGQEFEAPGGRLYAVGDRVVITRPNRPQQLVTSERAIVTAVHLATAPALTIRTDNGQTVTIAGERLDAEHLDHGYALTVHRTQSATVDDLHHFADGGGRNLGYVAMSRATDRTTVYAVADNLEQAVDDLNVDWSRDGSQTWLTPTAKPGSHPDALPADPEDRRRHLLVALDHLHQLLPPNRAAAIRVTREHLNQLREERGQLLDGRGPWATPDIVTAANRHDELDRRHGTALWQATDRRSGPWKRSRASHTADTLAQEKARARAQLDELRDPHLRHLDQNIADTDGHLRALLGEQTFHTKWMAEHPAHARRVRYLERELLRIDQPDRAAMLDDLDRVDSQRFARERVHRDRPVPEIVL